MDSSEANKENITLDVTDQILDNVDEENEIILPDQDQDDENIMTKDNDSLYGDSDDEYIPIRQKMMIRMKKKKITKRINLYLMSKRC